MDRGAELFRGLVELLQRNDRGKKILRRRSEESFFPFVGVQKLRGKINVISCL